jgi:hypothetical protein
VGTGRSTLRPAPSAAGIVGFAERGDRTIAVDELAGLAVALGVSVALLLDPRGPAGSLGPALDVGGQSTIPPPHARWLVSSLEPDDERARAIAQLAGVTSHAETEHMITDSNNRRNP